MSDCGCDKAMEGLEEFLHGELDAPRHQEIAEHLGACPPCEEEKAIGEVLTKKVKSACCEEAPVELKVTILARLDQESLET